MPINGDPVPGDLTLEVTVQDRKTMTQHRIGKCGTLTFRNLADQPLVITSSSAQPPFRESGCDAAVSTFIVAPCATKSVRISDEYEADKFVYSARIGDSEPEDPIVIIDRR